MPLRATPFHVRDRVRLRVARGLEEGEWDGPVAGVLARAWGALGARSIARRLVWREGVRVVCVGGATLGGSGKTPLAIACARELAWRRMRGAFVGHPSRAWPSRALFVSPDDPLDRVGDEALVAAQALGAHGV